MGQCVSSQDDVRDGNGVEERREERRSLITHEGGYQQEDRAARTGDPASTNAHPRPRHTNGHAATLPRERRREDVKVSVGNRTAAERGSREQELCDVVSADMEYGVTQSGSTSPPVQSQKGVEVMEELSKAYRWREQFEQPSSEFLALMDRLYMACQLHLTVLSSRGDPDSRREADAIVSEMVALRNHWGPQLLPSSTCNAFVRERIPLTLGVEQRQFRIDCAQFFEPVPFYGDQQNSCLGELMKLYRFSVYSASSNEVVLRYYLERSKISQYYHVLCFMDNNCHGQVKPYGMEPPPYWDVRESMIEDLNLRLLNIVSPGSHPVPKPLAVTVFPQSGD